MPKAVNGLFTEPKISTKGKEWFVWFRYYDSHTNKMKLVIKKGGANTAGLPNRERTAQLNALKKAILFKLQNQGWNPLTNTYPLKTIEQIELERLQSMGFCEALDFAHSKCVVATKTKLDYGTTIRFMKLGAEQLGIHHTQISLIKKHHIKLLLEHVKNDRKWSNHAYNKNLGYLGAMLERLIDWEIIEINPVHKIKTLPVAETQMYQPLTDDEKNKIREYLYVNHYRFFVYLMVIYHTGIRPKEVLALKVKDINRDNSEITIVPNLTAENSKTKNIRKVPINQHLQLLIREFRLQDYSKDFYIFGSPFEAGKGNRGSSKTGSGVFHVDYFKPSLISIKRDTVTKLWKKIVKDKLQINKYQYAMKHTGADDKILAGIDLDALRELYGHSSKFMTEKYARKVKEVYREQIMVNSPAF